MGYLISAVLLLIAVLLSSMLGYCVIMGFTDHWTWFLVAIGVALPDVVAFLAFTAAIDAAKGC